MSEQELRRQPVSPQNEGVDPLTTGLIMYPPHIERKVVPDSKVVILHGKPVPVIIRPKVPNGSSKEQDRVAKGRKE